MTPVAIPWTESSSNLVARADALLKRTHSRIAVNRRRLNPWWGVSGSSDDDAERALLRSVQERLECGALPSAPDKVWAGKGTGQICIICTKTICSDEIENEVLVPGDGVGVTLWAHLGCLNVWRRGTRVYKSECQSSEAGSANDHPA